MLIDPDNAKYRYTRGLAKRVNGDEAGAREDLREAAFLDEEDAENRYQLRVQRNSSEQRRVDKQQRDSVEANDNKEVVPQVGRVRHYSDTRYFTEVGWCIRVWRAYTALIMEHPPPGVGASCCECSDLNERVGGTGHTRFGILHVDDCR